MGDISARTMTVGVIGDPIEHSLSPTLHNAAFAALGVDACSLAFTVADGHGADHSQLDRSYYERI